MPVHLPEDHYRPAEWHDRGEFRDITFRVAAGEGIARIAIDRPEVHNAFRPETLDELLVAFREVRDDPEIGVAIFTGEGGRAFCSGGDQRVRGERGYRDADGRQRLHVLELQRLIRSMPKPVIAAVPGWAIGGGHVLHVVCDLTLAAERARFGQTGPRVGSFDAGFGAAFLARHIGQKRAREIWYLCQWYTAEEAFQMGLVNAVVPDDELEAEALAWARALRRRSPTALACLKAAFNADCDGQAGLMELAGHATRLFYMTAEAQEGRDAFLERREPEFAPFAEEL